MKRAFGLLMLFVAIANGSNVLIYQTNSTPVNGRVAAYLVSVDTPLYSGRADVLINPVLPNHPLEWCKTNGAGGVVAMSTTESNSIVSAQAAAIATKIAESKAATKAEATNELDDVTFTVTGRTLRALVEVMRSEINIIRTNMSPPLTARTAAQTRTAVRNEIVGQPDN